MRDIPLTTLSLELIKLAALGKALSFARGVGTAAAGAIQSRKPIAMQSPTSATLKKFDKGPPPGVTLRQHEDALNTRLDTLEAGGGPVVGINGTKWK